ncbi:putative endo-1 3(4)-beta-glucanase [Prunus yedoensis var. nudiflora]|uniref:glucan endo-1,3-beta-D-glucosidase n=1 Tax=Prunus yedoensis var. nudiflora TaxID=2094558 RepID=A0A314ZMC3_PRUYE|nr:putative endo-1 3(4)-beta-glucanase [Prunus yedoensis var. nudiflora]
MTTFSKLSPTLSLIPHTTSSSSPFQFPPAESTILPDPSSFFSANLLTTPLPTNSFFQNFALNNGDKPEYFHPYSINSSSSSLSLSYPSLSSTSAFISQTFVPDLTISASQTSANLATTNNSSRVISSFTDLSVTLDFPSSNLRFFLARGSPYVTCNVSSPTAVSISTIHAILESYSSNSKTKFTVQLDNNQTWVMYTSSPTNLTRSSPSTLTFDGYSGNIRIALVPGSDPKYAAILDRFSSAYPVSGEAVFTKPFTLEYKWEKYGRGDLLMLAHPLHLQLLSNATVLEISITWHSIGGVKQASYPEIVSALRRDVKALSKTPITTASSYFYGKLVARAARLALIAEEVNCLDVVPAIRKYLADAIEPWLDGTFSGNGFLYDPKWGGLVTQQGSTDRGADFGFGVYNDHHYHLGYFVYGISVLAKIDRAWGSKYKPQAYSLAADFINIGNQSNSNFPRLRCFDLYKLHSWAGGLAEFGDGRDQESTSEAVNAYYSAALMGLAYGDTNLFNSGSMLTALEIQAAQMWWHVREGDTLYEEEFTKENRIVGILWANKRDSGLWFAPQEAKEMRLGIQLLPISPITEILFSDDGFAKEIVEWALPALSREGVEEGWEGFVYAGFMIRMVLRRRLRA